MHSYLCAVYHYTRLFLSVKPQTLHEGHPNVLSIWPEYVEPCKLEGEEYKYHEMCDDRNHVTAFF